MPRYLGIIWPALALGICGLLMRLPTRPLRWGAVGLLLGMNLTCSLARIFVRSEPPVDLIAADVAEGTGQASTTRTYLNIPPGSAHPGHGSIWVSQGRYYLYVAKKIRPTVLQYRSGEIFGHYRMNRFEGELSVGKVKAELGSAPQVQKVIVWERFSQGQKTSRQRMNAWDQELLKALGEGWKRQGELQVYPVRMHWNWRQMGWCQRRVYVRNEQSG
jgi:hypothetical protein